jgi:hypothetical protein
MVAFVGLEVVQLEANELAHDGGGAPGVVVCGIESVLSGLVC